ncbi:hypothetical protein NH340_JMT04023 [Sarcoptes scabiei]|nr:hypothetical protein NH340_JMT04023 [Sarcoptes scabiei]
MHQYSVDMWIRFDRSRDEFLISFGFIRMMGHHSNHARSTHSFEDSTLTSISFRTKFDWISIRIELREQTKLVALEMIVMISKSNTLLAIEIIQCFDQNLII